MYIRMVWGKLRPGSWGEYEHHYNERVMKAGNVKGLRQRQLLRSTEDPDEGVSVSVWDTMEDMRNYETGEFRQNVAREVEHLYRGEYWVRHFEVVEGD